MRLTSVRALHDAYRAGEVLPSQVAAEGIALANASEPGLFTHVAAGRAIGEARASDERWLSGHPLGPLDGVPIVWKDLFDLQHTPTTAGSALLRNAPNSVADAPAVKQLAECGCITLGKVGLSEFAYSGLGLNPHYGTPVNRASVDGHRAPGGSSSGSAVAVGAGIALVGMGSDTGGSIRVPAAFNGLVGFKPSSGRLDNRGVYPLSVTLDVIGPLARTVQDCAWIDAALRGQPLTDIAPTDLKDLHFTVPSNLVFEGAQTETQVSFDRLLDLLGAAGATIERRSIPAFDALRELTQVHGTIAAAEAYVWHQATVDGADAKLLDRRVLARLERGRTMLAFNILTLQQARKHLIAQTTDLLGTAWLLMPTVVHVAPLVAALEADDALFHSTNLRTLQNTMPGNFLGHCGISLPMGTGLAGMPLGALISGPDGRDDDLLAAAAALENLVSPVAG